MTIYDGVETDINYISFGSYSGTVDNVTQYIEIDGKVLVDRSPALGKTLTRFRAKTDWNWHRIAAVKVNDQILTTGTLDNSGSVWTSVNEWKDGNANSSNAAYSQSARGDWFDVTLDSNIANFSELQFICNLIHQRQYNKYLRNRIILL